MKEEMTRFKIRSLAKITSGQSLEVKDSAGLTWLGTVDVTDEKHGVVWVFTNLGERKLVDMEEYSLFCKQISSGEDA